MAIHRPFVRWDFIKHAPHLAPNGGFYYVYTAEGASERAAVAVHIGTNHLVYKPFIYFLDDYADRLPLGDILEWPVKRDFVKWLDKVIYYSFLRYSTSGVPACWFLKFIAAPQIFGPEMLPIGLQPFFPAEDQITWIVIRHGYKVWPISIRNHQFIDGWANFRRVHGLEVACQVVFSCERQWVFNTIMFDETGQQMTYDWSTPDQPWQTMHPISANLQTSCLPSIIEHDFSFLRFGCQYLSAQQLHMVFNNYLQCIIQSFDLAQVGFTVGNQTWTISVEENTLLESASFASLCSALQLHPHDYLMGHLSMPLLEKLSVTYNCSFHLKAYMYDYGGIEECRFNIQALYLKPTTENDTTDNKFLLIAPKTPSKKAKTASYEAQQSANPNTATNQNSSDGMDEESEGENLKHNKKND